VEISGDGGRTWSKHGPIAAPGFPACTRASDDLVSATWDAASGELLLPQNHAGVIQPTVWEYAPGRLKMLMRATRQVGGVCASLSDDYGRTWSPAVLTDIPNSNSGLDAARLVDGRIVMVCNPTPEGRTPLSLLMSEDNAETWPWRRDVETEPGEYSYPSVIQAADGTVHVVYTYQRKQIYHLTSDPDSWIAA
jgi:predicted neuraminidase